MTRHRTYYVYQLLRTKNDTNGNSRKAVIVYEVSPFAALVVARLPVDCTGERMVAKLWADEMAEKGLNMTWPDGHWLDQLDVSPSTLRASLKASVAEMLK